MPTPLETHIENLKTALSELKATGENGFEGLIAVALYAITDVPFRLASSGYQRGVDGKAAFEGAVAFEGKLYTNDLPRTDVLSKIPDLVRHNNHADLVWVLGATCVVPTQLADDLRADGAKEGVSVLILDWVPSDFPRLAIALAMGGGKVENFLETNTQLTNANMRAVKDALAAIRADTEFPRHEQAIRKKLDAPGMATAMAEKANIQWFDETLSEKALARSNLGQPLAPKDVAITVLERPDLVNALSSYFTDGQGEDVICVHGEEGCGKSWTIIQSWLAQSDRPILIFATPDEFLETATQEGIEGRLIAKLIAQTGGIESEENIIRWRRRLNAWKDTDRPLRPRLILVMDGINQRPDEVWGRIIDNVATYLNRRGGRVIFSTRTHYFNTRVKRSLRSQVREVSVPKWSANERDEILRRHNVPLNRLNPSVAEFLRNPRILSIALEVFGSDVTIFEELSVERLLFEHIMAGIREDFGEHPTDFIAHLRTQAKALYERATAQLRDDLNIFESDALAVSEGRFYRAVSGETKRYELQDEGLILAVGLSIIENLRKAERNNRNLDDALGVVLEPIAALDKTAEAVIAAITVCAADDNEYSPAIALALIKGFVELQNPSSHSFATLVSFARARPLALADAARDLSLQGGHQPNFDWIQAALVKAAKSNAIWNQITEKIKRWLRAYSLSPECRMHYQSRHDPEDKVEQERTKLQEEINTKLAALSPAERIRHNRLVSMEGNIDSLSRLALLLLAGKNLESFAEVLTDWSFANALNGSFQAPTKDFLALISLNRRDWQSTQDALLDACADLSTDNVSKTGKWAFLKVLRATGDPDDDNRARNLYKELTKDRQLPPDLFNAEHVPCDPSATAQTNLNQKKARYERLDTKDLRQSMSPTVQDHFFVDDRPVIARFALESAVEKHREFLDDVIKRTGIPLRQGLIELREHGALITEQQARTLIEKWNGAQAAGDIQGLPNDEGILLQYALLIAFPFLEAANQIEIFLETTDKQPLLLELFNEIKKPDMQILDQFVEKVISSGDGYKQHLLLEIAADTGAELGNKICALACDSLSSPTNQIRRSAFGLAARSGHPDLLKAVAESNWTSPPLEDNDSFESWYGSLALLKAAQAKLINEDTALLDRISPRLYGRAALMLDDSIMVQEISHRIDASIRQAASLPNELIAPEIELETENAMTDEPTRFSVSEREPSSANIDNFFARLSENNEEFRERQNRNYDAFIAFREELTTAKAHIILDCLTCEEFAAIIAADSVMVDHWYDLFMGINDSKIPAVHNLILFLAGAIADIDPKKSAALLERTAHSRPLVHFTFGRGGVDLGSMSAWTGGSAPALDSLRRKRLDNAPTDQAIAVEVFSALRCGQEGFIERYIDEQLDSSVPSEIARGIMVAGFCDKTPRNDQILEQYAEKAGLPGKAYEAAIAAYRCNDWARHWFQIMCETDDPVTFWQAGILFTQCVDDRFYVWKNEFRQTGNAIATFGTSLNNPQKKRCEKLAKEREKKLFGQDAPAPVFVQQS